MEEAGPPLPEGTYIRLLAARLTEGVKEPLCRAKRFYDFITKRVRYSFMPSYFCLDRMAERCASDRVGDCGRRRSISCSAKKRFFSSGRHASDSMRRCR